MDFSTLKGKVADWLNRSDLTSSIPDFVNIAQRDLERGEFIIGNKSISHNWNCMEKRLEIPATSEVYLTMPDRFKAPKWMRILYDGKYYPLTKRDSDVALSLYPFTTTVKRRPEIYSVIYAQSEIMVRPTPDQTYVYEMMIYQYSAELSGDADTNWWTSNAFELLLWGSLLQAEPYLINDARIPTWKKKFDESLLKLLGAEKDAEAESGLIIKAYLPPELRGGSGFDINVIE